MFSKAIRKTIKWLIETPRSQKRLTMLNLSKFKKIVTETAFSVLQRRVL